MDYALPVAQVNERHPAVIAHAVYPPVERDDLARVGLVAQVSAPGEALHDVVEAIDRWGRRHLTRSRPARAGRRAVRR